MILRVSKIAVFRGVLLAIVSAVVLLFGSSFTAAQVRNTTPDAKSAGPEDKQKDDVDFGSRENSARTDLMLKADKKAYEEHIARAKEASLIAVELRNTFEAKQLFASEDRKKLDRLEKLTRRIRNEVGGSESDSDIKDLPQTISAALKLLADETESLRKEVENTPRHVVSASVIDQANKLIGLIDFIRREQ